MKNITIAGNIGRSAEVRSTQSGSVASFSVAVSGRKKDDPATWFDVSIWGARGEKLAGYLTKGTKVAVSGEFSTHEKDGRTYLKVNASDVTLMGGGEQRQERQQSAPVDDLEDSIPF